MKTSIVIIVAVVLAALAQPAPLRNETAPKAEDDFQLVKIADGIYAAIAKPGGLASGNAGFVVGDGGVLMVDTFFTPTAVEELIGAIESEAKQPIKYEFRDYLDDLRARVRQAIADGLTIEQAKQQLKLPEKYKSFAFQNFATPNVEDMYKELKGTK